MKALYGGYYLLCNFLPYSTDVSDAVAGLPTSWKKLPRLGLSQMNICEEEMGISHWKHISLIVQDNSETEQLQGILWASEEASKCFIWCWYRMHIHTFCG